MRSDPHGWDMMSRRVKERLKRMEILDRTDHKDRVELDRLIEERTGKPCDDGVDDLTDDEILDLLTRIWKRRKKKVLEGYVV